MNWQRIVLLLRFDLYYSLTRLKGWVFLVPFSLWWYLIFYQINKGVLDILQSQEGIMATSAIYGTDGALNLFIDHPPSVSLFYIISLTSIPFFVVLGGYDQFSSDFGSGFFRFLVARCKRMEIFLARFLSAFCLIAGSYLIVAGICAIISMHNDGYAATDVLIYSVRVYLTLMLYSLTFIAFMSLISTLVRSTLAALFLGMLACGLIVLFKFFAKFTAQKSIVAYLLANGVMDYLIELDTGDFYMALAILPVYVLVYAGIAFQIFNRRNL
ncbi:MAG: hypothetical protein ACI9SC_000468 [Gammaproteobacteria bacterium]|jgi:hypothetical protein